MGNREIIEKVEKNIDRILESYGFYTLQKASPPKEHDKLYGLSTTLIMYDEYEGYENAIRSFPLWNNNLIEIGEVYE